MLEEIDLATLATVHIEPVSVREFLGEEAIAAVRVAELWGVLLARESLTVHFIELFHEVAGEGLDTGTHRHEVHGEDILDDNSHRHDEAPKELLGQLVMTFVNAGNLHLFLQVNNLLN